MAVETGTYIGDMNRNNPPGSGWISEGDDHIRLLKKTIQNTFPGSGNGLEGPVLVTVDQFNALSDLVTEYTIEQRLNAIETTSLPGDVETIEDLVMLHSTQIARNTFPGGTRLLFHQASPPTHWTLVSTAIRNVVTADGSTIVGGNGGGGDNPLSMDKVPTHTHSVTVVSNGGHTHTGSASGAGEHTHTGSIEASGQHTHYVQTGQLFATGGGFVAGSDIGYVFPHQNSDINTGPGGSHTHTATVNSAGSHSHTVMISSSGAHEHAATCNANAGAANWQPQYTAVIIAQKVTY